MDLRIDSKYPRVNYHGNGKSQFLIGDTSSKGPFSIAMLVYRSVIPEPEFFGTCGRIPLLSPFLGGLWMVCGLASQNRVIRNQIINRQP